MGMTVISSSRQFSRRFRISTLAISRPAENVRKSPEERPNISINSQELKRELDSSKNGISLDSKARLFRWLLLLAHVSIPIGNKAILALLLKPIVQHMTDTTTTLLILSQVIMIRSRD